MSLASIDYILAIDLGTSGPKVALVSMKGDVAGYEIEPTGLRLLPNGGAEQDADEWWAAIVTATRRLMLQTAIPPERVRAVSCASQWSCTVAVGGDGRPLMNAISWMDTRGAPYVKEITGGPLTVQGYGIDKLATWLGKTGGIPGHSGKDSLAHILYLQREAPEIYRATYKFLEPKDYINLRLTGHYAGSFDSIILHWITDNRNIDRIVYDERLLKLAGVTREKFPDLKWATDVLGPLSTAASAELGLSEHTQVVVGTNDFHSLAIGAGAVRDYDAHLHIGTSSWVSCHVPFKKTDLFHNMASLPSAIPGRYYVANEQECAGAGLTFLRNNVFFAQDELTTSAEPRAVYQLFDQLVERAAPGSGGVIFTPWLVGERTPVEDPLVRGGFFNLSLQTSRAQLVRAVFEGVAYNTRWLLDCVEQFAGRRLDTLNFVGGGANSNIWGQIMADVLNRTIRQVKDPIVAGARGAAFLAMAALGQLSFEEVPARVQFANTYRPNPGHRIVYDEMFREFVNIYNRNQPIYTRLNRARAH